MTAFAAATFAVSVVAIAALDRIGAPDRLVRALGPTLALIALVVFGVGAHNATLPLFLAAGRRVAPSFAALAVAAVAAGAALGLGLRTAPPADPILPGAIVGVGLGASALGPLIRRFGATSLSDVVATRFSAPLERAASGLVVAVASALVAFAGFRTAVAVAEALVTTNRPLAETIVGAALLASVASGGLASLTWCAAATGAGAVFIALVGWAFPTALHAAAPEATSVSVLPAPTSPAALAVFIGAAIGTAGLIGAATPTVACRTSWAAARAGLGGVLLFVGLAALAFAGAPVFLIEGGLAAASPVATSLAGTATLAPALALAGVGVHGAARAFGVALASPYRPFPTLASVRLARMRAAHTLVVIGCAVADQYGLVDPATALIAAIALTLAVTAPVAALAANRSASPLAAAAATLTALAVGAACLAARDSPPEPAALLIDALAAAAAAFIVGSLVALGAPRRYPAPTPGAFDPFSEPSG